MNHSPFNKKITAKFKKIIIMLSSLLYQDKLPWLNWINNSDENLLARGKTPERLTTQLYIERWCARRHSFGKKELQNALP